MQRKAPPTNFPAPARATQFKAGYRERLRGVKRHEDNQRKAKP